MKPIVIFDFDGTLCDITHRLHLIQGKTKDWAAFYKACPEDAPKGATVAVALALYRAGHELWLMSGRSDEVFDLSMEWLDQWDMTIGNQCIFSWIHS